MTSVPQYIDLTFMLLMFASVAILVVGHFSACKLAGLNAPSGRTLWLLAGILAWIMLLGFLASIGVLSQFDKMPPRLPLVMLSGLLIVIYLVTRPVTRKLAAATPLHWPLLLQGFRLPLEFILWSLYINDALPIQMTFEGYNFDVFSGVLGMIIGLAVWKGQFRSKPIIIAYNIIGLLLLITIVVLAILSIPTPFRVFMNEPANTIVGHLPYVWLPGVFVLLAFFLHFFSIKQVLVKKN